MKKNLLFWAGLLFMLAVEVCVIAEACRARRTEIMVSSTRAP